MVWLNAVLVAYASLNIYGGISAMKTHPMSLVAGSAIAILVLFGVWYSTKNMRVGYAIAAVGPVLSLGRFLPAYLTKHVVWPAGIMALASGIALVALIAGHFLTKK